MVEVTEIKRICTTIRDGTIYFQDTACGQIDLRARVWGE